MNIADRIKRWREEPRDEETEDYISLLCDAEDDLRRLCDDAAASPHVTSGKHLGAVRRWIQWNCRNGEIVTWGSDDVLEHRLTVRDLEEIAERVRVAVGSENE